MSQPSSTRATALGDPALGDPANRPVERDATAAPAARSAPGRPPAVVPAPPPFVGLIANPVSARDIRRIVANAGNLQLPDRVNIVLRLLAALAATGIDRVMMMPDRAGLGAMLRRHLERERRQGHRVAEVDWLAFEPKATVDDSVRAARMLRDAGAAAIIVLGGDGTHRAVVRELVDGRPDWRETVPIAGMSTGTNNAFPEQREATTVGLAVGLVASGRLPLADALLPNKLLEVTIRAGSESRQDIALVDAVIASARLIGARALWKAEGLRQVFLSFAEADAIGLSSIGGLVEPVGRDEARGLALHLGSGDSETSNAAGHDDGRREGRPHDAGAAPFTVLAPIAPGLLRPVPIAAVESLAPGEAHPVTLASGVVALDGERELLFGAGDRVSVALRTDAFATVDVARCLRLAAERGLLRAPVGSPPSPDSPCPDSPSPASLSPEGPKETHR